MISKSKSNSSLSDYSNLLCDKISTQIKPQKKLEKIDGDLEHIPAFNEFSLLLKYNYGVKQLKQIAKEYNLKITGNKTQLLTRIYSHLYLSFLIIKIQKVLRGYLQRKYDRSHGPAFKNRKLCTNCCDFFSMEELTDIPYNQFFSFKDEDGFIYGFDAMSIHNLIYKTRGVIKNPYSTKVLSTNTIADFRTMIRISRVLKIKINLNIEEPQKEEKTINQRVVSLFHNIDMLGNYSNMEWFLTLNRHQLFKFIRELVDIWHYRANLDGLTKREICPPHGNPFLNLPHLATLQHTENIDDMRLAILEPIEKMVNSGINDGSKNLGAFYVLGALTLVNADAASALPWLHQAVCYGM